jgi:repressor LexA
MGPAQEIILKGITTRMNILSAINKFHKEYGFSPTVREIAEIVGLRSHSTVHGHLKKLKKEGKIFWNPAMSRTVRILDKDFEGEKFGI